MQRSWRSAAALVVGGVLLGAMGSVAAQAGGATGDGASKERSRHMDGSRIEGLRGFDRAALQGLQGLGRSSSMVRSERVIQTEDGFRTIRTDHGKLRSVDGQTITIETADGRTVTAEVSDDTAIRRGGRPAGLGDLQEGDRVIVLRTRDDDGPVVTRRVVAISAERGARLAERRAEMAERRAEIRERFEERRAEMQEQRRSSRGASR